MIRVVAVTSLTALLILVLYLPSTQPSQAFVQQVRIEHARTAEFWSALAAERILARMLWMHERAAQSSFSPTFGQQPEQRGASHEAGAELARVNARILESDYLRAVDALLVLATYRLATLMEWAPLSWVISLALLIDALLERVIKTKEFRHHNPEMFALYGSAFIMILCTAALALVLPWSLHPAVWASLPTIMSLLAARAIAHFHRRP